MYRFVSFTYFCYPRTFTEKVYNVQQQLCDSTFFFFAPFIETDQSAVYSLVKIKQVLGIITNKRTAVQRFYLSRRKRKKPFDFICMLCYINIMVVLATNECLYLRTCLFQPLSSNRVGLRFENRLFLSLRVFFCVA